MGKNAVIKSIGIVIARISVHKIVLKKGNRPEAKKHLEDEIRDYSTDIFEAANSYSWTKDESAKIKEKAIRFARNLSKKYIDINFTQADIDEAVIDTMQELMIIK